MSAPTWLESGNLRTSGDIFTGFYFLDLNTHECPKPMSGCLQAVCPFHPLWSPLRCYSGCPLLTLSLDGTPGGFPDPMSLHYHLPISNVGEPCMFWLSFFSSLVKLLRLKLYQYGDLPFSPFSFLLLAFQLTFFHLFCFIYYNVNKKLISRQSKKRRKFLFDPTWGL